jgi:hypothetical protein
MAPGLMVVFVLVQTAAGFVFLIWLWILRVRSTRPDAADSRERLLWLGVVCFTLAVGIDFYFMLGHGITPLVRKLSPPASFALACLGVALSLFGKGKGRIVTAIACCALAISWLPFVLP